MQPSVSPPRRKHLGTWIVVIVALLEVSGLAAFVAFKDRACVVVAASGAAAGSSGANGPETPAPSAATPEPAVPPATATPAAPAPAGTASAAGPAAAGDLKTQGDTNQVPDPNCVAKTTAGLLQSDPAPSAAASCAPMSPPPALKQAEQQVQAGATP
ncbi:MAG: hypothetical protein ABI231_07825 [Candidatus Tumulicola sp.]